MKQGNKLGAGTFGIVYSGFDPITEKEFAIKRNLAEKKTSFLGALREADILTKLIGHPHIIGLEQVAYKNPFGVDVFHHYQKKKYIQKETTEYIFYSKKLNMIYINFCK